MGAGSYKPVGPKMRKTGDDLDRSSQPGSDAADASAPARPAAPSDGELLERVASRDRSAFEELYRRFARSVFGLALRRLGDRDGAEDAVQETFTAVWRSARSYNRERGDGGPWIYAV